MVWSRLLVDLCRSRSIIRLDNLTMHCAVGEDVVESRQYEPGSNSDSQR